MKRTKFRYWNNKEQKMYSQSERGWDNFPCKLNKDDKWLEFTGLKDKNGVEIYEGDIVSTSPTWKYEVEWHEGEFRLVHIHRPPAKSDLRNGFSKFVRIRRAKEAKIIGNIYENKEFLKGKNEKN